MVTGHLQRVANNVNGHIKLVLEILGIDHKTYIHQRDDLIHRSNVINKITHSSLAFKFNMSKSAIGRICRIITDSYKQENVIISADNVACFEYNSKCFRCGIDTDLSRHCQAFMFSGVDRTFLNRLDAFEHFVIVGYQSEHPIVVLSACHDHQADLNRVIQMSRNAADITGKITVTKRMFEAL